ncbi:PilZ domain-containing protein [Salinispira pacifica]|uniref:PilZ domain-containing protein n=1 Tax=Salinispira pacifica TaxID=1307761 RepID=V5WIW1_9SPIO|nr:PilZ domain-containing protein [Salinispira pacifica]AHC15777.1 hypothetical protein L21SP2_2424 [Salinispira pacifica]
MEQQSPSAPRDVLDAEQSRVIFVSPEDWVKEHYITILIRAEYKCIVMENPRNIGKTLELYPGSIMFFNVDKHPENGSWYDIASSLEEQLEKQRILPVFIGKQTREGIKSRVKLDISFDAFDMGKSPKQTMLLIRAIIKQWYPSSKRRYIRVSCKNHGKTSFNLRRDGDSYNGVILDISSAGMACVFDQGREPLNMQRGAILPKIQLKLNGRLVMVDGVLMGSRESDGKLIYVVIFRNHIDTGGIQKIKDYVMERLQEDFEEKLTYE